MGRLDKDTEGLLLLTNEGGLAHDLLSPRHHVDKVYYARADGTPDGGGLPGLCRRVWCWETDCAACLPGWRSSQQEAESEALVTLREGKFHQVKRMLASQGKAGDLPETNANGQFDIGSSLAPGDIPLFDGRRSWRICGKFMKVSKKIQIFDKKSQMFFVEKRKNILHFDKNADII